MLITLPYAPWERKTRSIYFVMLFDMSSLRAGLLLLAATTASATLQIVPGATWTAVSSSRLFIFTYPHTIHSLILLFTTNSANNMLRG